MTEKQLLVDETNERNQVIHQLKDTFQEIIALTTSEQKFIKKEIKGDESFTRVQSVYRETQLLNDKQSVVDRIRSENGAHEKIMGFLNQQRESLEGSIQVWIAKHEHDTEIKTTELATLKVKRAQGLEKFEETTSACEKLEKIVEDHKLAKMIEKETIAFELKRLDACLVIQRWYLQCKKKRDEVHFSKTYYRPSQNQKVKERERQRRGKRGKSRENKSDITEKFYP